MAYALNETYAELCEVACKQQDGYMHTLTQDKAVIACEIAVLSAWICQHLGVEKIAILSANAKHVLRNLQHVIREDIHVNYHAHSNARNGFALNHYCSLHNIFWHNAVKQRHVLDMALEICDSIVV